MTLFRIAGLEKVWAVAEVPEAQAVRLARGQKVKAVLQADASQTFDGELKEILPQVSASTRTLQARFEVDNKGGKLDARDAAAPAGRRAASVRAWWCRRKPSSAPARARWPSCARTTARSSRAKSTLGADLGDDARSRRRAARRRPGRRQRPVPHRLRGAPAVGPGSMARPAGCAPASAPRHRRIRGEGKVESVEPTASPSRTARAGAEVARDDDGLRQADAKAFADIKPATRSTSSSRRAADGLRAGVGAAHRERQVIAALIRWSVGNRFLVLIATAFLVAAGVWSVARHARRRAARPVGHPGHRAHAVSRASRRRWSRTWSPIR